jgi:hypothetical protein
LITSEADELLVTVIAGGGFVVEGKRQSLCLWLLVVVFFKSFLASFSLFFFGVRFLHYL